MKELSYRFRWTEFGQQQAGLVYGAPFSPKKQAGFVLFGLVGASGMVVYLAVLRILLAVGGTGFVGAQSPATPTAMGWNYFLNNSLTYREYRLAGWTAVEALHPLWQAAASMP